MLALPTLSQITQWDVRHLSDAATCWSETAELWEQAFHEVWQATVPLGCTCWDDEPVDATQEDLTLRDLIRVRGCADALRRAARIAHTGAISLVDIKRLTLNAVDEARASAMIVAEDLSVTSARPHTAAIASAADHAEDIRHLAANLVALDHDIALRLDDAAHRIGERIPYLALGCA